MTGLSSLGRVVEVFTELGWVDAPVADVPTLPLGTAAQRAQVQADLRKISRWGRWWEQVRSDGSAVLDPLMVWFFAVRVGVDAGRATWMLDEIPGTRLQRRSPDRGYWSWRDDLGAVNDVMFAVVVERGPSFAQTFVSRFDARDPWHTWRDPGPFSGAVVRLSTWFQMPVATHVGFLEPWLVHALGVLTEDCSPLGDQGAPYASVLVQVPPDAVRDRFAEHVLAGALNPETSPMFAQRIRADGRRPHEHNRLLVAAVAAGWLDMDGATDLVLTILDAAHRPVDRKNWLDVWLTGLGASDEQVVDRADALVPVLANGDPAVIERLAPILVAGVGDGALADVALVTLAAPTKKALRTVLEALARRPCPSAETLEVVGSQVAALDVGRDRSLARAAQAVVDAWGLPADAPAEPVVLVEGMWRPVPPLWTPARFDHGEETPEALTQAAAELSVRASSVVDLAVERFLALANAVARRDPQTARTALAGVRDTQDVGLAPVASWVKRQPGRGLDDDRNGRWSTHPPLPARDFAVFQRLGEVPCLLSEPSTVDLRINPGDLIARLRTYQDVGASASEADLLLALTRLDVSAADDVLRAELGQMSVPVLLQSGRPMTSGRLGGTVLAGPAISRYLVDPAVEPVRYEIWRGLEAESVPESLRDFPPRLAEHGAVDLAVFPTWGGAVLGVDPSEFNRDLGLQMRRLARCAAPLSPTAVLDFLAARRNPHPAAADDAALAVTEARDRGLLRPGTSGTRYVDLAAPRDSLAAVARSLGEAAADGLLAVVWQILDDLAGLAAAGQRLATGAAAVVESIAVLAPEVVHAVSRGVADPAVLDLPGTRAVAGRPGASRAVTIAREVVAGLPAPTVPAVASPVKTGPTFEEIWPRGVGTLPAVVDDTTLTATWVDPDLPTKMLRFDLLLPDHPGERFEVVKGWTYDLEQEGQCQAMRCPVDTAPGRPQGTGYAQARRAGDDAWLSWDDQVGRLVVAEHRWRQGRSDGPSSVRRSRQQRPPLSTSLTAVALGLMAQDGDFGLTGEHLVMHLVRKKLIGWAGVRVAVSALLCSADVSPARMVRVLEKNPTSLPVLWPLLTEPVRVAGAADGPPPRWLNRVFDVTTLYADHLREAARCGLLPADAVRWPGLAGLAARPGRTAALAKARFLRDAVEG